MNFFNAGIPLGRWFGIRVLIHWTFLLFAAFAVFSSKDPQSELIGMAVLFTIVLLHEFGHAMACRSVGGTAEQIVLWPLGGLAFVQPPNRPWPHLWTTVGGPLVNVILLPVFWVLLAYVLPRVPEGPALPILEAIIRGGFLYNFMLLVFNLLPVFPMDGGRILQEILWLTVGIRRSYLIAGMVGVVGGISFVLLGLGAIKLSITQVIGPFVTWKPLLVMSYMLDHLLSESPFLIVIGIMGAMESYALYRRAEEMRNWQRD